MSDLTKWLRTYWSDDYNGPPMASDELGRKAADEIERLREALEEIYTYPPESENAVLHMKELAREALEEK